MISISIIAPNPQNIQHIFFVHFLVCPFCMEEIFEQAFIINELESTCKLIHYHDVTLVNY